MVSIVPVAFSVKTLILSPTIARSAVNALVLLNILLRLSIFSVVRINPIFFDNSERECVTLLSASSKRRDKDAPFLIVGIGSAFDGNKAPASGVPPVKLTLTRPVIPLLINTASVSFLMGVPTSIFR